MKKNKMVIMIVIIVLIVAGAIGIVWALTGSDDSSDANKKGGSGTGMFELPYPTKITVTIKKDNKTFDITDKEDIDEIVNMCATNRYEDKSKIRDGFIYEEAIEIDFNNNRAVLSLESEGEFCKINNGSISPAPDGLLDLIIELE